MDKTKRKELEDKLYEYLPAIANNREITEGIKNYYIDKNINSSVPMRIINKNTVFNLLTDVDLCMLILSINKTPNTFNLNVDYYFQKDDIERAENYKKNKLEKENVIIFHDVDQTNEKIWLSSRITFQELVELASNRQIGYNFNTQREGKQIMRGNDIVKIPTVNRKAVNEMIDMWKLGTFIPNTITFNARNPLDIEYNAVTRTLKVVLADDDYFEIIDGYHRYCVCINIMQQDPTFKFGFYYLRIVNFTEEEAQQFIVQEDKHTPINREHIKTLDVEDISARVSKYIQDYGTVKTNLLYHKFAIKDKELELDKYCLFSTISHPLKVYFDINSKDISEVNEIRDMVLRGLNHIISLFPKEFKEVKKSQESSVVTSNGIFVLYLAILKELFELGYHRQIEITDANKLENSLTKIVNKIDFSFNNPIWQKLKIVDKDNKIIVKKISTLDCDKVSKYANELIFSGDEENANNSEVK